MFKNITIKTKLLLGFTSIAFIVFFVTIVSFITTQQNISLFSKIVSVDNPRLQVLLTIKSLINQIEAETLSYNIGDGTADDKKYELLASLEKLDSLGRKYDKLILQNDKEKDTFFTSLSFIQKELIQDTTQMVNYKEQKAKTEVTAPLEAKIHANIQLLQKKINLQVEKEQKSIDKAGLAAFASNERTMRINIFATIGAFFVALFIGLLISRIIVRPIIQVRNAALEIAEGKLNQRVVVLSQDEIGQLATTFNDMAVKLERSYAEVEQKVEERTHQLHDEQSKLQASINSLSVGFIMVDRNNNIAIINQTAKTTFCSSANSFTIETCTFAHIETQLKGVLDLRSHINTCLSQKKMVIIQEVAFQNKFFKVLISPIVAIGVIGAVVLFDDITEAKIMERSKDEFFSIASHELRTPLTAIRGNTSMMEDFYKDKLPDQEFADMLKDTHNASVRLIGIVNDFLDMSRLEQGKMEFKKEPIMLDELITSTIKEYQIPISQKHISLLFSHDPNMPLPKVYTDTNKTKQVLINLIGNALKFTMQGSITISTQVTTGFVKILVTDTGRGISQANQNLLFRKFQQANTSLLTRDTTKGTGLGLYISRLIMQGMGGTIKLETSTEGQGTTFSFTLPIATQAQLTTTPASISTVKVDSATGLEHKTETQPS